MIAVDTNLLAYAHREDSLWHDAAYFRIVELAEGRTPVKMVKGKMLHRLAWRIDPRIKTHSHCIGLL